MTGVQHFDTFLLSSLVFCLLPGQDTMYVVASTASGGLRAGIVSACGINFGNILHVVFAGIGMSSLLYANETLFMGVLFAGGGYLCFLGVCELKNSKGSCSIDLQDVRRSTRSLFGRAVLTNLLNVKVITFFLAFIPQFVNVSSEFRIYGFFLLGTIFVLFSTLWCLMLATGISHLRLSRWDGALLHRTGHLLGGTILLLLGLGVLRSLFLSFI
ncbi:MAG: LysE family translocator [Bdellovibrionales bacterium]|nr:LysE family translocator [Bdellovibrionales bacterium]